MRIANDKGIALVLALFLMAAMSVIGASLMFLSQTEVYSSMNYRLMSQARYGAESGIHKTANFILYSYTPPSNTGADLITNYDTTKSPVTLVGSTAPIVLSASAAKASNYPVAAVQTAFNAAVAGTIPAGSVSVAYASYATLMSMQQIDVYGGGVQTIQTWQVTSLGSISAGRTAQIEVSAVLETPKIPAQTYAAFATAGTCGALNFNSAQTRTDSYDSTALVGGNPALTTAGGNVGTNGNLSEGGNATIGGTLASPRVGVGTCSAGNVDALSSSGGASVNGHSPPTQADIVTLPAAVSLPAPTVPAGVPTSAYNGNNQILLNGASVGDVTVNANSTLTLGAVGVTSTININSIKLNGNATLQILGTVILNVVGTGQATPIDITGGSVANLSFDPSTFQVMYAGSGSIKINGGSHTTAMIYAPNASATMSGNADFYGSIVAATFSDTGGGKIHYDRHLASSFFMAGNSMMSSFSWKKY